MDGRLGVACVLALLTLVAGCAGSAGVTTEGVAGEGTAAAGPTTAATPTPTPEPYAGLGAEVDSEGLWARHADGLEAADSFTARRTSEMSVAGNDSAVPPSMNTTGTVRVDRAEGRYLVEQSSPLSSVTWFVAENVTYRRFSVAGPAASPPSYGVSDEPSEGENPVVPDANDAATPSGLRNAVTNTTYTVESVDRSGGEPVAVLVATGPAAFDPSAMGLSGENGETTVFGEVSAFRSTLRVTPDGTIRAFDLRVTFDGERATTMRMSLSLSDVDDTGVRSPAWLDEAEAAAATDGVSANATLTDGRQGST
ncbi:hypothetical protein ACFO0N_07630 [Halobium salinum]|uniref:Uncharacterized protein n=1 Tax=Halobium salinum TaxID=1364940 RepID=A0ABD5PBH6_9EURY|nr:hypothetical protein [Halobium salinum]